MDVSTIRERIEYILDKMTEDELKLAYKYIQLVYIRE